MGGYVRGSGVDDGLVLGPLRGEDVVQMPGVVVGGERVVGILAAEGGQHPFGGVAVVGVDAAVVAVICGRHVPGVGGQPSPRLAHIPGVVVQGGGAQQV